MFFTAYTSNKGFHVSNDIYDLRVSTNKNCITYTIHKGFHVSTVYFNLKLIALLH